MNTIKVVTKKKYEVIDVTKEVEKQVKDVKEGTVLVFTPHATAGIIINENYDPNIGLDLMEALDNMMPEGKWRHDKVDNNGAAHIKSAIIGPSETVPVKDGKLLLGTWQSISFCEFDGPRERRIILKVIQN